MKALFLISDPGRPSTRHRVLNLVPGLEERGVSCTVEEVPEGFLRQARLFRRAGEFDVTVLQRRLLTPWPARSLRRHARRLIFDFDDAIVYTNAPEGPRSSRTREARFRRVIGLADEVWAGNRALEEMARPHLAPGARIRVVPTVVDGDRWRPRDDAAPDGPLVIGWMGAPGNLVYVEELRDAFDRLAEEFPRAVLRIVSQRFFDCRRMPVEKRPWRLEEEIEEVRRFDIALAPLRDDPWTRGKCALRILNYFGAAVPVVCSPVGANAEVVTPGETGEHARNSGEWHDAIARLARDAGLRRRMGRAGRERVEREYSIRSLVPRLVETLENLVARRDS